MIRSMLRLAFGKVGRSLLILAALGLLWAAWWIWPERPLRTVVIERKRHAEFATVSPDGSMAVLVRSRNIEELSNLLSSVPARLVSLDTGKELIDESLIGNDNIIFSNDTRIVLLSAGSLAVRPFDNDLKRISIIDALYAQTNGVWQARRIEDRSFTDLISFWPSYFSIGGPGIHELFEVRDIRTNVVARYVPGKTWCGFAHKDRGWTQNSPGEPQIILREWDVSFPRPPYWLWLITGGAGGFLISQ